MVRSKRTRSLGGQQCVERSRSKLKSHSRHPDLSTFVHFPFQFISLCTFEEHYRFQGP